MATVAESYDPDGERVKYCLVVTDTQVAVGPEGWPLMTVPRARFCTLLRKLRDVGVDLYADPDST